MSFKNLPKGALPPINTIKENQSAAKIKEKELFDRALHEFTVENKDSDYPRLSSRVLRMFPGNTLERYIKAAKKLSNEIISSISSGANASKIAKVNSDPMDIDARLSALALVANEYTSAQARSGEMSIFSRPEKDLIQAIVIDETLGLGILEPLWQDREVTEIIANGPFDIQIERKGTVERVPAANFIDAEHLESLIKKLYNSINKNFSATTPGSRARLHDNSRLFAVDRVIAPDGPNFNIRKHSEDYWSPQDIIEQGTASEEVMTYLGNLINQGLSFLIIGGTGTGKTTLLNALTGFYSESIRIITLEENLEMKPHPRKLIAAAMETLKASDGAVSTGVNMRALVEFALQMRPDNIIVGEVTDAAAYDLCQALNTGHAGASTVHANNIEAGMTRMMSLVSQSDLIKGKAALELIVTAFDFVIWIDRDKVTGQRSIRQVAEITGKSRESKITGDHIPELNVLWELEEHKWVDEHGNHHKSREWVQRNQLSENMINEYRLDLVEEKSWAELTELFKL